MKPAAQERRTAGFGEGMTIYGLGYRDASCSKLGLPSVTVSLGFHSPVEALSVKDLCIGCGF